MPRPLAAIANIAAMMGGMSRRNTRAGEIKRSMSRKEKFSLTAAQPVLQKKRVEILRKRASVQDALC